MYIESSCKTEFISIQNKIIKLLVKFSRSQKLKTENKSSSVSSPYLDFTDHLEARRDTKIISCEKRPENYQEDSYLGQLNFFTTAKNFLKWTLAPRQFLVSMKQF